jgi:hypothetical protein
MSLYKTSSASGISCCSADMSSFGCESQTSSVMAKESKQLREISQEKMKDLDTAFTKKVNISASSPKVVKRVNSLSAKRMSTFSGRPARRLYKPQHRNCASALIKRKAFNFNNDKVICCMNCYVV